jgi:hypothetical protein
MPIVHHNTLPKCKRDSNPIETIQAAYADNLAKLERQRLEETKAHNDIIRKLTLKLSELPKLPPPETPDTKIEVSTNAEILDKIKKNEEKITTMRKSLTKSQRNEVYARLSAGKSAKRTSN